jgi:hypothetical protein
VFDFAIAHPDLMRLMAWSNLEQKPGSVSARGAAHDTKAAALKKARERGQVGTAFPPVFLLTAIMALATAWSAASAFGPSIDPDAANRPAVLRKHIAAAVDLIAKA